MKYIFTGKRGAVVEVKCKCCGGKFIARVADRKRGWGKFCSKSCKAKKQEAKTGASKAYHNRSRDKSVGYVNAYHDDGDSEYWDGKDF